MTFTRRKTLSPRRKYNHLIRYPRQYFKAAYYYLDEPHRIAPPASVPEWEDDPGPDGGEHSGAVSVTDFPNHVAKLHADTDAGFAKEYSEIQKYCVKQIKASSENSSHPDNKCKNRYLNIVACKFKIIMTFLLVSWNFILFFCR
jgi:hypothetical protein